MTFSGGRPETAKGSCHTVSRGMQQLGGRRHDARNRANLSGALLCQLARCLSGFRTASQSPRCAIVTTLCASKPASTARKASDVRISQRGTDEQHQGKHKFNDHKRRTHPRRPPPCAATGDPLHRGDQVDTRRVKGRRQSEDDAGRDRRGDREGEDTPIDGDRRTANANPWNRRSSMAQSERVVARLQQQQHPHANRTDEEPERAAHDRQDDAFGQQLAENATASCAERSPDRHLACSDVSANEEQVRDVDAGDE